MGHHQVVENDGGTTHTIVQGDGCEQGDAPHVFSWAAPSIGSRQSQLVEGKFIFVYLDDINIVGLPERTDTVYTLVQNALWQAVGTRVHQRKNKVWNRCGEKPAACEVLERIAKAAHPMATVWRGSELPAHRQGMKVLGAPLERPEFVRSHLVEVGELHQTLLARIPMIDVVASCALCRCSRQLFGKGGGIQRLSGFLSEN